VHIVDQPVLAGWHDGDLYLEVHTALEEDERDLAAEAEKVIAAALERRGDAAVELDREAIATIVSEHRGIPFPIGGAKRSHAEYLAAARVVENTVPVSQSETAAALE
jgi:hypothetical protein